MNNRVLPNQLTTWAGQATACVEFFDWQLQNVDTHYRSQEEEIAAYLDQQIEAEGRALREECEGGRAYIQLLVDIKARHPRLAELTIAKLELDLAGNTGPALRLINGERLTTGLDDEYVLETQCYNRQRPAPALHKLSLRDRLKGLIGIGGIDRHERSPVL